MPAPTIEFDILVNETHEGLRADLNAIVEADNDWELLHMDLKWVGTVPHWYAIIKRPKP